MFTDFSRFPVNVSIISIFWSNIWSLKLFCYCHSLILILLTDSYIQHLTQQTFRSTLQDSQPLAIRHLTKKSIASGVKKVYQQVSSQKWRKVTELSALVLQQLDSSEEYNQPEPVDTSVRRSAEMDEMAPITTQSFCEFYRSAWQLVIYVCDIKFYEWLSATS